MDQWRATNSGIMSIVNHLICYGPVPRTNQKSCEGIFESKVGFCSAQYGTIIGRTCPDDLSMQIKTHSSELFCSCDGII